MCSCAVHRRSHCSGAAVGRPHRRRLTRARRGQVGVARRRGFRAGSAGVRTTLQHPLRDTGCRLLRHGSLFAGLCGLPTHLAHPHFGKCHAWVSNAEIQCSVERRLNSRSSLSKHKGAIRLLGYGLHLTCSRLPPNNSATGHQTLCSPTFRGRLRRHVGFRVHQVCTSPKTDT